MSKFKVTWDSGYADGETTVTAASENDAWNKFERKYPNRMIISVEAV